MNYYVKNLETSQVHKSFKPYNNVYLIQCLICKSNSKGISIKENLREWKEHVNKGKLHIHAMKSFEIIPKFVENLPITNTISQKTTITKPIQLKNGRRVGMGAFTKLDSYAKSAVSPGLRLQTHENVTENTSECIDINVALNK